MPVIFGDFFSKMRGGGRPIGPPRVDNREIAWSWVGSFIAIAALAGIGDTMFAPHDLPLMLASFGASAVLVFGATRSPLAQPRNVVGGHVLSALVGVACWKMLHDHPWLAQAAAVATAIALMHATRTLHPPGGATALIAVIGSPDIHQLGFLFVLVPAASGALMIVSMGIVLNNIPASRRYPEFWL